MNLRTNNESARSHTGDDVAVLDLCRDIEFLVQEMYLYFAEIFRDDAAIRELWTKTAYEENNHANQFILAAKLRSGMISSVRLRLDQATSVHDYIRRTFQHFRHSPPSLEEALRTSIETEKKIYRYHVDSVAMFNDPSQQNIFAMMMASDQGHIETLEEVYQQLFPRGKESL